MPTRAEFSDYQSIIRLWAQEIMPLRYSRYGGTDAERQILVATPGGFLYGISDINAYFQLGCVIDLPLPKTPGNIHTPPRQCTAAKRHCSSSDTPRSALKSAATPHFSLRLIFFRACFLFSYICFSYFSFFFVFMPCVVNAFGNYARTAH